MDASLQAQQNKQTDTHNCSRHFVAPRAEVNFARQKRKTNTANSAKHMRAISIGEHPFKLKNFPLSMSISYNRWGKREPFNTPFMHKGPVRI